MKNSAFQKLNIFKTSPLIIAIAIIEVIILVCVSTFAWFMAVENNKVETDLISVEPDSGLEIDFDSATEKDYVNIWNYLNEFQFEPVTSLDGRNVFVPTTGTFNSTDTSTIKFREATVNDMNSKYINIDFTLTNTGEEDMPVFLNSRSYFRLYDPDNPDQLIDSKALRIAFYQNDGSSGKITSSLLSKEYDDPLPEDPDDGGTYTIYLDAPSDWTDPSQVKAYVWADDGKSNASFPGVAMTYDATTQLYSYSYNTAYNQVVFSYNGNQNQTVNLEVKDGATYVLAEGRDTTWALDDITINGGTSLDGGSSGGGSNTEGKTTVYFYNSLGWSQPYAYIWKENGNNDVPLSAWPGKPMTHISGAVYYYTFSSEYDSIIFNDGASQNTSVKTGDIYPVKDGYIYMIGEKNNDDTFAWSEEDYIGSVDGGTYPVISPGVSTGFQRPYAPVTQIDNNSGQQKVVIPAFASSIDDYNFGAEEPLFTIAAGQKLPLSMIIWIEGTDPDCSEDVYAGKYIDMNLVFATQDSGEEMYTYQFLDKTKENWIDDVIETDTGVRFNPVIQLYDVDNNKGYHMSVHDDENGNPTIWQCVAPQSLMNSENIEFRRVNPMKEEEVWNYWDTSGFGNGSGGTIENVVVNGTVYFSAFADGSPVSYVDDDTGNTVQSEIRSCGGLWGNHETSVITVYDGTEGQWIKNDSSVLTISYTYNNNTTTTIDDQTIEYKASGSDNSMYYFVVPKDVYSKTNSSRPDISLKRYFNFNDKHAMNSSNNTLTFDRVWSVGQCTGAFGQITGSGSGDFYWGSDVLYVQAKNAVKDKLNDNHVQVHFYANSDGSDSANDTTKTLYKNDKFAAENDGIGYACVIPNDRDYYFYRVERCQSGNASNVYNITKQQTINRATSEDFAYINSVLNTQNICAIDYLYLRVYLECTTSFCGSNWDPEIYIWDTGNNGHKVDWPGDTMKWQQNSTNEGTTGYNMYYFDVNISLYNKIKFSNDYDYGNSRRQSNEFDVGSDTDTSGIIYRWESNNNSSRRSGVIKSGINPKETLHISFYPAEHWP